jgi:hypothetical protein
MSTDDVDIEAQAQARIAGSLRDSARFRNYVAAITSELDHVKDGIRTLDAVMNIDAMGGVNLDRIGEIVNLRRKLMGSAPKRYFGFRPDGPGDYQYAKPQGDRAQPLLGGMFYERGGSLTDPAPMEDNIYRHALKAKCIKNTTRLDGSKAWVEKIYDVLFLIFPDATFPIWIYEGGMCIEVGIGTVPSLKQVALLVMAGIIPVPMGVDIAFTYWDDTAPVFAFADSAVTHPAPYGDRAYPARGGVFAERITRNVPG